MSNPERQHFIPKSYLKNFAEEKDGNFFLEGKRKTDLKPIAKLISTNKICWERDLYTLPEVEGEDKYKIERFYASNIDSVYPRVYRLLVDPDVTTISKEQRIQILNTTLSLYFRTPKFLNQEQAIAEKIVAFAVGNFADETGRVRFAYKEHQLDFHLDDTKSVIEQIKVRNKVKFITNHLKEWQEFVQFKLNDGFMVFKNLGNSEVITSDNPVDIHCNKRKFNLFDPSNVITVPLDNNHYLRIAANEEGSLPGRIFRGELDRIFALQVNNETERNSVDWILGKPNSVTNFLNERDTFNKEEPETMKEVSDTKRFAKETYEFGGLMIAKWLNQDHPDLVNMAKRMKQDRIHKNNPTLKSYEGLLLRKFGIIL